MAGQYTYRLQHINGVEKDVENLRVLERRVEPTEQELVARDIEELLNAGHVQSTAQGLKVTTAQLCRLLFEHKKRVGVTFPKDAAKPKAHGAVHRIKQVGCLGFDWPCAAAFFLLLWRLCHLGRVTRASEAGTRQDMN